MDLTELGSVLGGFFEGGAGPSHNELDIAFARTKTTVFDPAPGGASPSGIPVGKTKRVRQALAHATDDDPAAGLKFAIQIVALLRAGGAFAQTAPSAPLHTALVTQLREAFRRLGYTLHQDGTVTLVVIDNLEGTELTSALAGYVRRLNANPDDASLQVGGGKDLDEAVARHVLKERLGTYPVGGHAGSFPVTLAAAFTAVDFEVPPLVKLHDDPHRAVQQALFILGQQVNRLRNEVGTGHGRPDPSTKTSQVTPAEGRLIARATALLAGALLDRM